MTCRRALNVALVAALAGIAAACSSAPPTANDTTVADGDVMHGRMIPGRDLQAFTIEGVESSLLDFTVEANQNEAAPLITVQDPEGQTMDVPAATLSSAGSATVEVHGLVLPKTGVYKVVARPSIPGRTVYYRFKHRIRFAPPPARTAFLTSDQPAPVYVSAPRGGLIAFTIQPHRSGDLKPDILGVKDPWGGPALDRTQVPAGAHPPRVSHAAGGAMILTFTAPRPGLYTILAAAKPGSSGVGTLSVDVRKPEGDGRFVYHGAGAARAYGMPGRYGTPDGPAPTPRAAPRGIPAPPPPPSATAAVQPGTPPVDPPIAQR